MTDKYSSTFQKSSSRSKTAQLNRLVREKTHSNHVLLFSQSVKFLNNSETILKLASLQKSNLLHVQKISLFENQTNIPPKTAFRRRMMYTTGRTYDATSISSAETNFKAKVGMLRQ